MTVRHCTGQSLRAASTSETVQDVMLGRWNAASATSFPASPVEWLTDNGSCGTGLMKHGSLPGCWGLNRRTRRYGVGE